MSSWTSGRQACHSWRKDTSRAESSSESVYTTVTAITSSPSDIATEMPSAVSLDMPDTGTITSEACLTGPGGTCPIASATPSRA